jgi:hypothetical protein
MRFLIITVCVVLIAAASGVHAQKYAGEFMALGGGARAMAMGGAFIGVADDATAAFWNPAGLASFQSFKVRPSSWQAIIMHAETFGNLIDYNYGSAAFPLKQNESAWGVTFIHMGIPDIRVIPLKPGMIGGNSDGDDIFEPDQGERLNFNYEDFPLESANDMALLFSYAQRFGFGSLGANVKIIRNDQVAGVTSFGIGCDVGFLRRSLWKDLAVGLKLQDATGTYIGWSTGTHEFIYPALKAGIAYPLSFSRMNSMLVLAVDGDFRFENRRSAAQFWVGRASADVHLGAELFIRELVALRGGLDMGRPTAGMGIMMRDFGPWNMSVGIDYALLIHDQFDTTHRVSLMVAH